MTHPESISHITLELEDNFSASAINNMEEREGAVHISMNNKHHQGGFIFSKAFWIEKDSNVSEFKYTLLPFEMHLVWDNIWQWQ